MEMRRAAEQLIPLLKAFHELAVKHEQADIATETEQYEQFLHRKLDFRTIRVVQLSGEEVIGALTLQPDQSIAEVMRIVSSQMGCYCRLAKQSAEGQILAKESTLAQQRIEDGATLQAICFSPDIAVFGTRLTSALAAVKTDGSVIAWGNPDDGGDLSAVREQLNS